MNQDVKIAYFSMEIGIESAMPTYSGGLGVLAGDTIASAAEMRIPMAAVTLLYRKGYFYQKLDASGWQTENPVEWSINDYLEELPQRAKVIIEGRTINLRAWKYIVKGDGGFEVPVYFLDVNLPENSEWDRTLTDYLYGGDVHFRLCQEVVLGMGGVRMLRALGYNAIERFHMNEGHAGLLTLELLDERLCNDGREKITQEDIDAVRKQCVFTTHTPVRAGHDQFSMDLVNQVLGGHRALELKEQLYFEGTLNMTYLALQLSHYVNGVAKRHGEVSRHMFANYAIDSITNGVNLSRWVSPSFAQLFDRHIPGWRDDNFSLRYAFSIPRNEIWEAHKQAKQELIKYVNRVANAGMDFDILTIGFARRASTYKRADLIFRDLNRLKHISADVGALQFVFAGKAHPQDQGGKELIQRVYQMAGVLQPAIKVTYLENYDMDLARQITAGVDIWLNTPIPPREASGTSGMKAALNGVPSLSILDGWWIEGCIEGVTGWAIGELGHDPDDDDQAKDIESLYTKLEQVITPLFYHDREGFVNVMLHAIALNGSFFNTQRMLQQYVLKAYYE